MRNSKKAFTLAEALIAMVMLGVIAAITLPILISAQPNEDVSNYKKAMLTMQSAIGDATNEIISEGADSRQVWADNSYKGQFCKLVAERLNTTKENCDEPNGGTYNDPQIITADGIRFWKLGVKSTEWAWDNAHKKVADGKEYITFCMDRKLTKRDISKLEKQRGAMNHNPSGTCGTAKLGDETVNNVGLRLKVRYDGKVVIGDDKEGWEYEQSLADRDAVRQDEKNAT